MQAIIMAAGKGSRIHELTNGKPKAFLEINGQKLIERNIEMLHRYGIEDITIVIGYQAEEYQKLLGGVAGIRFVYNPFYELVNVIASFWLARENITEDFLYLHADTICEDSIIADLLANEGDIVLPVDTKPCDEEAMKVRILGDKIVQISKKIPTTEVAGEFIGIAKIRQAVIPALNKATTDCMREKLFSEYFEAAIQKIIDQGKFSTIMLDTRGRFWAEIDFAEDYERAKLALQ